MVIAQGFTMEPLCAQSVQVLPEAGRTELER
jgi:hypothetical protein